MNGRIFEILRVQFRSFNNPDLEIEMVKQPQTLATTAVDDHPPLVEDTHWETHVTRAESTLQVLEGLQEALSDEHSAPRRDREYPDYPADFLLSVIVPIYNERETICRVIGSLMALPVPLEVIAVDDGSTDGTKQLLQELDGQHPNLRVILQEQNQGKGNALRMGFANAAGSHVVVQDADLEYNPRDIPTLLRPLVKDEADVVYGSRFLQEKWSGSSSIHRFGNRILTALSNRATGWKLTDMETCYKAFRRDLLDRIQLEQDGFGFEVELTAKLAREGARVVELPVSYQARGWEEGKKIGWRDAVHAVYCICRYR